MKLDLDGVEIAAYVALHTDPDTVTIVNEWFK